LSSIRASKPEMILCVTVDQLDSLLKLGRRLTILPAFESGTSEIIRPGRVSRMLAGKGFKKLLRRGELPPLKESHPGCYILTGLYRRAVFNWFDPGYSSHWSLLLSYCPLPSKERDRVRVGSWGPRVHATTNYYKRGQTKKNDNSPETKKNVVAWLWLSHLIYPTSYIVRLGP
jgi:hypothetical protein